MPFFASTLFLSREQRFERYTASTGDKINLSKHLFIDLKKSRLTPDRIKLFLLEHTDSLFSIMSEFKTSSRLLSFIRTADENTIQRHTPNHPCVLFDNMLLRTLMTARAINHVLKKPQNEAALALWADTFITFEPHPNKINDEIETLERDINTRFIKILHEHNLTEDIDSASTAENLLLHYRNLASLLDPTPIVKTTIKENHNSFIETAVPITKKTLQQKQDLTLMANVYAALENAPQNYQNVLPTATQKANAAFAELAQLDDRMMPSYMRGCIAPTVKNAWGITNEICLGNNVIASMSTIRCGTLAYVGKGESETSQEKIASENLEQLRTAIASQNKNLHITLLNTNMRHNNQHKMVKFTRKAIANSQYTDSISEVAINTAGTLFQPVKLASNFNTNIHTHANRRNRATIASTVAFKATKEPVTTSVIMCAEGQDRTGITMESAAQLFITAKTGKTSAQVQALRARGMHNPIMASIVSPGSPFIKPQSNPNVYNNEFNAFFFAKLASTNKRAPLNKHPAEQTLKTIPELLSLCKQYIWHLSQSHKKTHERKHKIAASLIDILENKKTMPSEKLEKFSSQFNDNKATLSKHRSTDALKIINAITFTLLSATIIGLAVVYLYKNSLNFWSSHGKNFADKIKPLLQSAPETNSHAIN